MRSIHRTLRTALLALRRNLMRSLLTCLGVVIGVAAVIAVMEIGQGASSAISEAIATLGANVVQIDPSDLMKAGVSTGRAADVAHAGRLRRDPPGVRGRSSGRAERGLPAAGRLRQPQLGAAPDPRHHAGISADSQLGGVAGGQAFTDDDVRDAAPVCLIGQTPARAVPGRVARGQGSARAQRPPPCHRRARPQGRQRDRRRPGRLLPRPVDDRQAPPLRQQADHRPGRGRSLRGQVNTLSELYPDDQAPLYPQRTSLETVDVPTMTRLASLDDVGSPPHPRRTSSWRSARSRNCSASGTGSPTTSRTTSASATSPPPPRPSARPADSSPTCCSPSRSSRSWWAASGS